MGSNEVEDLERRDIARPHQHTRSSSSNETYTEDEIHELRQIPSEAPGMPATIETPGFDTPPDGGYGWVCVAASFMVNACTWGVNSSYGVYLAHYLEDNVYPGATPLQYAFVGGLSISTAMLLGPLATILLRKTSTRKVMSLGIIMEVGGLIAGSFSTKIWQLFLTQGILFGLGMGCLFVGSSGVVSQWFDKKRSMAMGISAGGSGIGGLVFSLSIRAIIVKYGTEWAFRIVAIVVFVVNSVSTALIKDRNKHINPNQRGFDLGVLRRYEFLLILGWGFFSMLGYVAILFSLPDFAKSRGFSGTQGSVLGALLNLGMAFGRPLVGLVSDRAGRINISWAMTLASGLSCFIFWLPAKEYGMAVWFALFSGAICGTFWTTIAPVCVEVVGIRDLPSALSLMWLSVSIPTSFSEAIALQLRRPDFENPYLYTQIFSGAMFIAASMCMWLLRAWKLEANDLEEQAMLGSDGELQRKSKSEYSEKAAMPLSAMDKWKSRDVSKWVRFGIV